MCCRWLPQYRERAVASPEVAALFHSTWFRHNLPYFTKFDTVPLCAFAFWRVRFLFFFRRRAWLRTPSGRPPPPTICIFKKFQNDRRKQPPLSTKPKRRENGSAGKKQKKRNSENSAWMRKPSNAFIHTIGRSSIRNASICSGR